MRIAILTTDNREHFRNYDISEPVFGTAPQALLSGFSEIRRIESVGAHDQEPLIENSKLKIHTSGLAPEVHVISCTQRRMKSPAKLAENIWFHSLHVPKWGWMRTGYAGCVLSVRRVLRQIRPDIVHGQGTERDCALSAVYSGYPNVLTLHGNMRAVACKLRARPGSFHGIAAFLEGWSIPRSAGIVCISSYTERLVRSAAKKTWLVPNAVEEKLFQIPRRPTTPAMLLCVGAVVSYKNQLLLLDVLEELARQFTFRVVFAGAASTTDPYSAAFLDRVQRYSWAQYRGVVDRNALSELLSQSTFLVHPSLEDNCPMAVLEALAAGVPCIASRIGGIPDLVNDGETGYLFDPTSIEDAKSIFRKALGCIPGAARLGTAARIDAQIRFHPRNVALAHLDIYREVSASFGR